MEKIQRRNYHKQQFFQTNEEYKEIPALATDLLKDFQRIDESEDEVWLMQCPKGISPTQLQGHKLKLPGRSHIEEIEAIAVEDSEKRRQAFGYCNSKGRYAMRFLSVQGSIVLRRRLKANNFVSTEGFDVLCPPAGRVPKPEIKIRHPLLGAQFEDRLQLRKFIKRRLQDADGESLKFVQEVLKAKAMKYKSEGNANENKDIAKQADNSSHSKKTAENMSRRKHKSSNDGSKNRDKSAKRLKTSNGLDVSDEGDLQWIKQL